jgi:hypothetical protein
MPATQNISVTLPVAVAREAKRIAKREKRSMSALVCDALRSYKESQIEPVDWDDEDSVMRFMLEAKKTPMTPAEMEKEEKRLMQYGARQAKRLGITRDEDIVRIIHESRARRNAASSRSRH